MLRTSLRRVRIGISPHQFLFGFLLLEAALSATACGTQTSSTAKPMAGAAPNGSVGLPFGGAFGSSPDRPDSGVVLDLPLPDAAPVTGCDHLDCNKPVCSGGTMTSISGVVYAPNGTLPLYNALVFVPNATLPPLPKELSCDRCGSIPSVSLSAATISDERGRFVLQDVPAGKNVPIVFQVGKWRRQVVIPEVLPCRETKLSDPEQTRLPKNRSEGDMPRIAITTGACDNLICLLPKLGIDASEFGVPGDDLAVTFFAGDQDPPGAFGLRIFGDHLKTMPAANALWSDVQALAAYDMVLFSCECTENLENKRATSFEAVTKYLAAGGRVFGTDLQYVWYRYSSDPALQSMGKLQEFAPPGDNPVLLDTSFPKGKALADWFSALEPALPYGEVNCSQVFDNFTSVREPPAQIWGRSAVRPGTEQHPRFLTVNTPAGAALDQQCGRAVHLDAHITSTLSGHIVNSYPLDCGTKFEPGEEILAFFFFDAAACIQDEHEPPRPPPVVK